VDEFVDLPDEFATFNLNLFNDMLKFIVLSTEGQLRRSGGEAMADVSYRLSGLPEIRWKGTLLTHGVRRYLERKLSMALRKFAEWAVWSVALAGGTMLLQAQKKEGASHSAPATHEHSVAPQKQEHTPPPMREHANPAQDHPPTHSQARTFGTIRHKRHAFRIRPPVRPSSIRSTHMATERSRRDRRCIA